VVRQLVKQGAGTLSLTADNAYKGGTDLQSGTLSVEKNASLGSGVLRAADGTTLQTDQNVTLANNVVIQSDTASLAKITVDTKGNNSTISGVISDANTGSGALVKEGAGTLSLTNNNTYKGGANIEEGTLSIARASSLGKGDVTIADGTTLETQKSTAANKTTTLTQNISLSGSATISTNDAENITQITSTVNDYKDPLTG
jgi:fibronectin-binding autotransporter adhesin